MSPASSRTQGSLMTARLHFSLFILAISLISTGCGGGGQSLSGPPAPTPTPTPAAALAVSPASLSFSSIAGGSTPATQRFSVSSTGSPINWTASASTTDGGTWLAVSPTSGTTPATVTVSTNVAGLGATTFSGSVAFTAASSTATGNVSLQLASPQPPYFTGQQSFILTPQSSVTITLPDGTQLDSSDQLLVSMSPAATLANMQSVADVLNTHNAAVVGEIPVIQVLQVQMHDPSVAADLITQLQLAPAVSLVVPNLFAATTQSSTSPCADPKHPLGTGWLAADHPGVVPPDADDVVIAIADVFAQPGQPPAHGDVVLAYAQEAAGTISGKPIFQKDKNIFQIPLTSNAVEAYKAISDFVMNQPANKKIIINFSSGPATCPSNVSGTVAQAKCWAGQVGWYTAFNALSNKLNDRLGDRVLLSMSAGNANVSVPSLGVLSSCHFIVTGAMDQAAPSPTLASFSTTGGPVTLYAPGCNVSPNGIAIPPDSALSSGTSFAAPQTTGFMAAEWAKPSNSGLSACQLGNQMSSLPKVGNIPVLDGTQLQQLVQAAKGQPAPPPNGPSLTNAPCDQINVQPAALSLAIGKSAAITVTTPGLTGATPIFLSSNPLVATVSSGGAVTAVDTGTANIEVSVANVTCSSSVSVVVGGETYVGSISVTDSLTFPNTPGWIPSPVTISTVESSIPVRLVATPSLLTPGPISFTAILVFGSFQTVTTFPAETCTVCNPPITLPSTTDTETDPGGSGAVSGTAAADAVSIPIGGGFPPLTGTLQISGNTVTLSLTWSFTQDLGGGDIDTVQLSGKLIKQ